MKSKRLKLCLYMLLGLVALFSLFQARFPQLIESAYSTKIYYWTIRPYSLLTGIFPFSLAEILVVGTAMFVVYKLVKTGAALLKNPKECMTKMPGKFKRLALILLVLYLTFNSIWGFNYSRMSFADISGLPVKDASLDELAELALHLTYRANELREQVDEDARGVMKLSHDIKDMFDRSHLGYEIAAEIYPELSGRYGRPKGLLLSRYLSYTGIGGLYFPLTAEANVNIDMPHFKLPSTTTHEMAHQMGFAREDEANYIAYLASTLHPDPDFQYAGVMLALTYTMNALHRYDVETWQDIRSEYSEGINRDLRDWQEYRSRFEGRLRKVSNRVNDAYLMANRQEDGVRSYGRMVDLMLAEFRAANINDSI